MPKSPPEGSPPNMATNEIALLLGAIDRSLAIPLATQLRGALEYGILMGALPVGARLPPVREMAEEAGIATMTVVGVYSRMKEDGLLETRGKAGTFVAGLTEIADVKDLHAFAGSIDALLDQGVSLGMGPRQIAEMVETRARLRELMSPPGIDILLVGLFEPATRDYEDQLKLILHPSDRLRATTLDALRKAPPSPRPDMVLTLITRRAEVQAEFGGKVPVGGMNFIPSPETRIRLAEIEQEAHVGMVSTFAEFTALMRPTVLRFAPHIADMAVTHIDDPNLSEFLKRLDVVIYASGAERVLDLASPDQTVIEYRHMPDMNAVRTSLLPLMDQLREAKTIKRKADARQ